MIGNQENHHLSTVDNQLYGEIRELDGDGCSGNGEAVRDEDLSMTVNKAYQHSPNGTSSCMEDLNTTVPSLKVNKAYRSVGRGINGSLERCNENNNTLITAIKEFQSTRLRDRSNISVHRHTDVIYNQIHQGVTRGADGEREPSHDVALCQNVAYREPTGPVYGECDDGTSADIPYYSYPSMM